MDSFISFFKRKGEKQPIKNETKFIDANNNNNFCCPKCNKGIYISLDPNNFSVSYKCQNDHEESNIEYKNFYNDTYIKQTKYLCQQCKKEKTNISCDICDIQVCNNCELEHNSLYSHKNFSFIEHSNKKSFEHNSNITYHCRTCGINLCFSCLLNDRNNLKHNEHEIIKYLIPDDKEIENYEKLITNKINSIIININKLNKWLESISSLVRDIIENLNCEIMIKKLIFNNFKYNYLDIINYSNYKNVLFNSDKINFTLEKFLYSETLKEETDILTSYFFCKNENIKNKSLSGNKNSFSLKNEDENNINNFNNFRNFNNISNSSTYIDNNDIFVKENLDEQFLSKEDILSEKALLIKNKYIYNCNLEKNEISKIDIYKNKENNENGIEMPFENHNLIFQNIINLKNSFSNKDYILFWNDKNDLTKLLNLLNDKKNENKNNVNNVNIEENMIIEDNKNYASDINSNDNCNESYNSLLNKDNSSHNSLNHILFNSGVKNNKLFDNSYSNFNVSKTISEREIDNDNDKVIYVYISNTGKKFHSKPKCRRMKSSIKVTLEVAKNIGKTQCSLCKFDSIIII